MKRSTIVAVGGGLLAFGAGLIVRGPIEPAVAQMPANLTAFSAHWELVSPHDTNLLTRQPRAILLPADGNFAAVGWNDSGTNCVQMALVGGVIYPLSPKKICDTGTDAASVLVIY